MYAVGSRGQSLTVFLQAENLHDDVEQGLRGIASEFDRNADAFARDGLAALEGWSVRPTTAVSRFGSVTPRTKTLRLTTLDCSASTRRDTILHEVAHILTDALIAKRENHGPRWRKIAKALGARPQSRGEDSRFKQAAAAVRESRQKVVARCDRCGYEVKRLRRSAHNWRRYSHGDCGGRFSGVADPLR
jgi:predicted SprT family Zn-dependent metalloprotease